MPILRGLLQEYLIYVMLNYAVHFLASFVRKKFKTECEFSEPAEQQQFVRGRAVPAKDVRTLCERS